MALLELLLTDEITYLTEADVTDGALLQLTVEGRHTFVIDGTEVTLGKFHSAATAQLTIVAGQGATIHLDQRHMRSVTFDAVDFRVEGRAEINLDGGDLRSVSDQLATHDVTFSSAHTGCFNYTLPQENIAQTTTFRVKDMKAGDQFNVMGWTAFGDMRSWRDSDRDAIRVTPDYDADQGELRVQYISGLARVDVVIPMSLMQADAVMADWAQPPEHRQYWRPVMQGGMQAGLSLLFPSNAAGYVEGAFVHTPNGLCAIETLSAGDRVICADGIARPVVGRSETDIGHADPRPIRIGAGALAEGYPDADLVVSPQHRIWAEGPAVRAATGGAGGLIAARQLVGMAGIRVEDTAEPLRYHHLALAQNDLISVNGVLAEAEPCTNTSRPRPLMLVGGVARQVMRHYGARREMIFENPGQYLVAQDQGAGFAAE